LTPLDKNHYNQGEYLLNSVKLAISLCRAGSTALIHALSQNGDIDCHYQPIKAGNRSTGIPDYGIFDLRSESRYIVAKETIGHGTELDCTYQVFPNEQAMRDARPLFLLREPQETFNAWKILGWTDIERFVSSARNLFDTLYQVAEATGERPLIVTYNGLTSTPEETLRRICEHWGIPFVPQMLEWQLPYLENDRIRYPDPTHKNYLQIHHRLNGLNSFRKIGRKNYVRDSELEILNPLHAEYQALTGDMNN
jgi:hypothetical protein